MMLHDMTAMIHRFRLGFTALLMLGVVPLLAGCSSFYDIKRKTERITRKAARKITNIGRFEFSDSGLKKKVAIGPMDDKTSFQIKNFGEVFQADLMENLRGKCSGILFVKKGDPAYPDRLDDLFRASASRIDNFELVKAGRQFGLNAIVTGSIIDIREYAEERGIMWFRDTHKFMQMLVNIAAYDVDTGAKLADESYMYETELDPVEFDDSESSKKDRIPIIEAALLDAAEFLGDEICDAVRGQPWTGYVTSVTGNRVEISSGSDAGLSVGQVLEVFDRSTIIQGAEGQRFIKPGEKTGEIKITEIDPDRAVAENLSDQPIVTGSAVRPK